MMRRCAIWLLGALCVVAQAAQPDLTGTWSIAGPITVLKTVEGTLPPMNAGAKALYEKHLAATARGDRSFDGMTRCLPPGLPRLMLVNEPFEILQRDHAIYFIHQLNRLPRRAYFGEPLPVDPDPAFLGFSVARWDGAALVIDSAGFRDETLLDEAGLPHSEALHLTERYQFDQDGKTLHARFTIDDPKTFTRTWSAQADYRKRPGYELSEEVCADKLAARRAQKRKGPT